MKSMWNAARRGWNAYVKQSIEADKTLITLGKVVLAPIAAIIWCILAYHLMTHL
jgi:hypothetical protein